MGSNVVSNLQIIYFLNTHLKTCAKEILKRGHKNYARCTSNWSIKYPHSCGINGINGTPLWLCTELCIADRATIPHLKGDNEGFHMRYSSMIWYKRLQSDRLIVRLPKLPLVLLQANTYTMGMCSQCVCIIMADSS